MRNYSYPLLLFLFLALQACDNDTPQTKTETTVYQWIFEKMPTTDSTPRTIVYVSNGEEKIKAFEGIGLFGEMGKRDYALFNVPKNNYSVCYGYWAGMGQVGYMVKTEKGVDVYGGTIDEANESKVNYELLIQIE